MAARHKAQRVAAALAIQHQFRSTLLPALRQKRSQVAWGRVRGQMTGIAADSKQRRRVDAHKMALYARDALDQVSRGARVAPVVCGSRARADAERKEPDLGASRVSSWRAALAVCFEGARRRGAVLRLVSSRGARGRRERRFGAGAARARWRGARVRSVPSGAIVVACS